MGGGYLSSTVNMGESRDGGSPAMATPQQQQKQQQQSVNLNHQNPSNRSNSSATNCSSNTAWGSNPAKLDTLDEFPVGMRVLVVDDDPICLTVLERMLVRCAYRVTTCGKATEALSMLREDIGKFDLVISDVYMPDMDGFKLLELVGLEMDLPVIMMSGNGETSAVMKGITHGACDYLLKPVRIEELRNIWQHVVRKKRQEVKAVATKSVEEGGGCERQKRGGGADDADYTSSATDTTDSNWKLTKRRKGEFKDENEEDNEQENDDPSTMKRPRVVWSVELHQQFVSAVNQLGIEKAVPKRILELMGVQGLTRENVASHLQKYRLYLKRLSGVTSQQGNMSAHFGGPDPFCMMSPDISLTNGQLNKYRILGRMNTSNGIGFSGGGFDPGINQMFLPELPRQPHANSMLRNNTGLLSSVPNGLHLDPLSEPHHLHVVNELEHYTSNNKVYPQLNGNLDVSVGSLGATNGNLASNPHSDPLLLHILHSNVSQQGGGSSSNLSQPRGGLDPTHLLANDINFAPVGSLSNLTGSMGPGVRLSGIMGSAGGRDPSPSVGCSGASLSSPMGSLVRRPLMAEEQSNHVNSTSGTYSMAHSVQSPKASGDTLTTPLNEGLDQQQSLWPSYQNPMNQLSHGPSQGLPQDSLQWPGLAENLSFGDMGHSLSAGLISQFSSQGQDHGIGFAPPSQRGSYFRQSVSFPVSSALDGRMVRSSHEP